MNEPKTVLVVDDASLVRLFYRSTLEQAGFRVEEAINGIEALEKLPGLALDLLIVDVNMPQMDGISLLQKLRQAQLPAAAVPALVTSTESRASDFAAARDAGANFYLVKPLDQETLINVVAMMTGAPS